MGGETGGRTMDDGAEFGGRMMADGGETNSGRMTFSDPDDGTED